MPSLFPLQLVSTSSKPVSNDLQTRSDRYLFANHQFTSSAFNGKEIAAISEKREFYTPASIGDHQVTNSDTLIQRLDCIGGSRKFGVV
jgi:hypothetical protein